SGGRNQFGGNDLAVQVAYAMKRRGRRYRQYPPDLAEALLGIDQVRHCDHLRLVLLDPIAAGEAGIQNAIFDIAGHLLSPDQHTSDFGVIDPWEIGTAAGGDLKTSAAEQINGRILEASLGNAELELHALPP